jgi:hypothetical protein
VRNSRNSVGQLLVDDPAHEVGVDLLTGGSADGVVDPLPDLGLTP